MNKISPEKIDELLPQTQCGLCGYGGCMPYAEAIIFENASIDLCPPGGVSTLQAIAALLNKDATLYIEGMRKKEKPPQIAIIREEECIGCTKCIQACPVDAILGTAKKMHTIISTECSGCELCVPPCPVNCIDLIYTDSIFEKSQKEKADQFRARFYAREKRVSEEKTLLQQTKADKNLKEKRKYIENAISRAKQRKKDSQ